MGFRLADASRNAATDSVVDRLDVGGAAATIKVYTGSQPTNPDTAASGTLLATFDLPNPAFGASSAGVATLLGVPISTTGAAAGTAGWFRMTSRGGLAVADGTVGTSGANLNLNTTTISVGVTVQITSGTVTMPLGS